MWFTAEMVTYLVTFRQTFLDTLQEVLRATFYKVECKLVRQQLLLRYEVGEERDRKLRRAQRDKQTRHRVHMW